MLASRLIFKTHISKEAATAAHNTLPLNLCLPMILGDAYNQISGTIVQGKARLKAAWENNKSFVVSMPVKMMAKHGSKVTARLHHNGILMLKNPSRIS